MGLNYGMNSIFQQGVFVNDAENVLFEYKIFHTDVREPDHIIITDLRSGKTYGPKILDNELSITDGSKLVINNLIKEIKK